MSQTAETEGWAYLEAMYHLCKIISQRLNPDAASNATYSQILDNCKAVEHIRDKCLNQLRNKDACKSALDRLQHFAIRLHTSFILSVCCRPALMRSESTRLDAPQKKFLADRCKLNLTETVRMFLAMHQLSVIPTRSWAFTYHGLSSAVLLGILGDSKGDPEVRQLQGDLISALSATAAKEQTSPQPHIHRSDHDIELSGPLSRALMALKNIYDHGSVIGPGPMKESGVNSGAGSGTRTPLQPGTQSGYPIHGLPLPQDSISRMPTSLDPHQNAALAMAEMQQNGGQLGDMQHRHVSLYTRMHMFPSTATDRTISNMPFVFPPPQQNQQQLSDVSNFDPATYMSPMDLYDHIFWGMSCTMLHVTVEPSSNSRLTTDTPDPFGTPVDSMNFDFLAHPPPGQPQQQFYF